MLIPTKSVTQTVTQYRCTLIPLGPFIELKKKFFSPGSEHTFGHVLTFVKEK